MQITKRRGMSTTLLVHAWMFDLMQAHLITPAAVKALLWLTWCLLKRNCRFRLLVSMVSKSICKHAEKQMVPGVAAHEHAVTACACVHQHCMCVTTHVDSPLQCIQILTPQASSGAHTQCHQHQHTALWQTSISGAGPCPAVPSWASQSLCLLMPC